MSMLIFVPTNSVVLNELMHTFIASGFESLIIGPTRQTEISSTCIEQIYMSFRLNVPLALMKFKCPTMMQSLSTFISLKLN